MNKRPNITEKTRNAFMEAFCDLYVVKPIEKITINEVARLAGYNRGTFYQYFKDIYELLAYLEDYLLDTMKNKLLAYLDQESPEQIFDAAFINSFISVFDEHSRYYRALLGINGNIRYTENVRNEMKVIFTRLIGPVKDDKYVLYLLDYYTSAFFSLITCWFRNDQDLSVEELAGLVQNIFRLSVTPLIDEYGFAPSELIEQNGALGS